MSTPVEVWAPAFAKVLPDKLRAADVFSSAATGPALLGTRWCNLCETAVRQGEQDAHVRQHQRERAEWRKRTKRQRERDGAATLRQVNRLRREAAAVVDRASEDVGRASSDGRPEGPAITTKEENDMEGTTKTKGDGPALFKALLDRVRKANIGKVVVKSDGAYARVLIDGGKRNAGYVVAGKTLLNVYPQALAKDLPGVSFKKVKLGSHHYGRGEAVVRVETEDHFDNAVLALELAAKLPAPERKGAAKPKVEKAEVAGNGQPTAETKPQAKPDPKPSAKKGNGPKTGAKAAASGPKPKATGVVVAK